ncbi:uncharacterized protein LOC111056396 [Nilaparvata lugens]|uniref:uncharacterized protein LOC111056396 n=1 Tax=Nilaparvata lugens TaxID=108931 RepID=UPI00193DFFCB|nr:uncharacterized protein LOC111056396 [Nilaparvata lugens]
MDQETRKKLTREEYEIQFFGFSHTMLNKYVKNSIREEVKNAVASLMGHLKMKYSKEIPEEDFDSVGDRLTELFMNASKTPLTNLENTIEECISIPDHVLLVEDEKYQRNQHTGVDMNELDKKIEQLKKRAVKAKYMECRLQEELNSVATFAELGTRKVNELQKRALAMKEKNKRNNELVEKLEENHDSDDEISKA